MAITGAIWAGTDQPRAKVPGDPPRLVLTVADYIPPRGAPLAVIEASAATYADPAPGSLFAHPAWLRAYRAGELLVIEGRRPARPVPNLVFAREGRRLLHLGRLLCFDEALVAALSERLLARADVDHVVFEDVEIAGPIGWNLRRCVFHYQNNWRMKLGDNAFAHASRKLLGNTRRRTAAIRREVPGVTIGFETAPDRRVLDALVAFGRDRFESRGRRYGIDSQELERLAAVASEVGHGTIVRRGDDIVAADLTCICGDAAYFVMHGYDPDYTRYGPGLMALVHSIEACRARGLAEFSMLWGDMPYKARVGAGRVPLQTIVTRRSELALLNPGYLATIARYGWYDLKRRLKPHVFAWREKLAELRQRVGGDQANPNESPRAS